MSFTEMNQLYRNSDFHRKVARSMNNIGSQFELMIVTDYENLKENRCNFLTEKMRSLSRMGQL